MSKHRYYYFDDEACSFVEVKEKRVRTVTRAATFGLSALVLAFAMTWGMDRLIRTPQELALMDENEALVERLAEVGDRIESVSQELEKLRDTDQELYRTLLNAGEISDDVMQVGVGGSDPYPEFNRFSPVTSNLLRRTAQQIDRLDRQLSMQNDSYRELAQLADEHSVRLAEMPAIVPVNGTITSAYGLRMHPVYKVRRMHAGLDFHARLNTPIYATGDGVISETGRDSGLGRYVKIEHKTAGYESVYGHMSRIPEGIRRGKKVKRGDLIGYSGNTGLTNAPHLHYEVRDAQGRSLNPIFFLAPSMTPAEYERLVKEAEATTMMFD